MTFGTRRRGKPPVATKGELSHHQIETAKLSRDAMRDRMHDAFEAYATKRAAALKMVLEAHQEVIGHLIAADDWLVSRGVPPGATLTWPSNIEDDGFVDFGTEFDELSANAEEAQHMEKAKGGLLLDDEELARKPSERNGLPR